MLWMVGKDRLNHGPFFPTSSLLLLLLLPPRQKWRWRRTGSLISIIPKMWPKQKCRVEGGGGWFLEMGVAQSMGNFARKLLHDDDVKRIRQHRNSITGGFSSSSSGSGWVTDWLTTGWDEMRLGDGTHNDIISDWGSRWRWWWFCFVGVSKSLSNSDKPHHSTLANN